MIEKLKFRAWMDGYTERFFNINFLCCSFKFERKKALSIGKRNESQNNESALKGRWIKFLKKIVQLNFKENNFMENHILTNFKKRLNFCEKINDQIKFEY